MRSWAKPHWLRGQRQVAKFKVGDHVRVLNGMGIEAHEVCIITHIDSDGQYRVEKSDGITVIYVCVYPESALVFDYKHENIKTVNKYLGVK